MLVYTLSCSRGVDAHAMAARLDGEFSAQVPTGSSKQQVIDFLTRHAIEYHDEQRLHLITAAIHDVEKRSMTKFGVYMKFELDANDRLLNHEIKALGTGP